MDSRKVWVKDTKYLAIIFLLFHSEDSIAVHRYYSSHPVVSSALLVLAQHDTGIKSAYVVNECQ